MHIQFESFIVIGGHTKMPLYAKACTCKLEYNDAIGAAICEIFSFKFLRAVSEIFSYTCICATAENPGPTVVPDNLALVRLLEKFIWLQAAQRTLLKFKIIAKVARNMSKYSNNLLCL